MSYIPGQGIKKPLNMMQAPIYPDIKKAPPTFKSAGRHWDVDVGKTMMETESYTHLLGDSVLAKSYRDNIDKYGQSSYQEKITVFRPPLQNSYEDFGPLNRLPTKLHAIVPHINPGTTSDSGGTTAYATNNAALQEVNRYISDTISSETWRSSYFMPMSGPLDTYDSIMPDLVTTLPSFSLSAGHNSTFLTDAPDGNNYEEHIKNNTQVSGFAGINVSHTSNLVDQTSSHVDLHKTIPNVSGHSGYSSVHTVDGETQFSNINLVAKLPSTSASSGVTPLYTVNGETRLSDITLNRNLPVSSISSGHNAVITIDGSTQLGDMQLNESISTKLNVANPGSEFGYQTTLESYTSPDNYIKLKENPRVPSASVPTFDYKDSGNTLNQKVHFQEKRIQPVKSYGNGLNSGIILKSGIDQKNVGGRYIRSVSSQRK